MEDWTSMLESGEAFEDINATFTIIFLLSLLGVRVNFVSNNFFRLNFLPALISCNKLYVCLYIWFSGSRSVRKLDAIGKKGVNHSWWVHCMCESRIVTSEWKKVVSSISRIRNINIINHKHKHKNPVYKKLGLMWPKS